VNLTSGLSDSSKDTEQHKSLHENAKRSKDGENDL
jgi:hypothetical protein